MDSQDPNKIQEADAQLFNSDLDKDYLFITKEMDMMEEYKKLFKQVNIQSSELSSYIGRDVIITLKGDQRDHPSIYGKVSGVNDEVMLLMPSKVDNIKIPKTTINILDIAKCTTVPEEWDQHDTVQLSMSLNKSKLNDFHNKKIQNFYNKNNVTNVTNLKVVSTLTIVADPNWKGISQDHRQPHNTNIDL